MRLDESRREAIAERLCAIALEAGNCLLRLSRPPIEPRIKADGSPTTEADLASERLILRRLAAEFPEIPAIAEETASGEEPKDSFFLVDPLDGTKEFICGGAEYSVNIALIRNGRPIAAAIDAPALGRCWRAGATAMEATSREPPLAWRRIRARLVPATGPVAVVSRRHDDPVSAACLARVGVTGTRVASSALKFCLLASGEADIYVRCGQTMEWDTAAGDHILGCAGGRVLGPDLKPIIYGRYREGYRNLPFAALGDPALEARLALPTSCHG